MTIVACFTRCRGNNMRENGKLFLLLFLCKLFHIFGVIFPISGIWGEPCNTADHILSKNIVQKVRQNRTIFCSRDCYEHSFDCWCYLWASYWSVYQLCNARLRVIKIFDDTVIMASIFTVRLVVLWQRQRSKCNNYLLSIHMQSNLRK